MLVYSCNMPLVAFIEPAVQAFACDVALGNERGIIVNYDVNDSQPEWSVVVA